MKAKRFIFFFFELQQKKEKKTLNKLKTKEVLAQRLNKSNTVFRKTSAWECQNKLLGASSVRLKTTFFPQTGVRQSWNKKGSSICYVYVLLLLWQRFSLCHRKQCKKRYTFVQRRCQEVHMNGKEKFEQTKKKWSSPFFSNPNFILFWGSLFLYQRRKGHRLMLFARKSWPKA